MKYVGLKKVQANDLFEISLMSSQAKEKMIYIYEVSDLSKIVGFKKAEILRNEFLRNGIKVKQITNNLKLSKFTENDEFVDKNMDFRYVPKEKFKIRDEILIFDDMVAVYNTTNRPELLVIKNKKFAENQKELFRELWNRSKKITINQ